MFSLPSPRAESDYSELLRVPDSCKVTKDVDEDSQYAVFVSYIEIYNNYVFDLLDETPVDPICPKWVWLLLMHALCSVTI